MWRSISGVAVLSKGAAIAEAMLCIVTAIEALVDTVPETFSVDAVLTSSKLVTSMTVIGSASSDLQQQLKSMHRHHLAMLAI